MLTEQQFTELVAKVGKETGEQIKKQFADAEKALNDKAIEAAKGSIKADDFEKFKTDEMEKINAILSDLEKIEKASKEQGAKLNAIMEHPNGQKVKGIDDFLALQIPRLLELKKSGQGFIEVTGEQLKSAGVTSIAGSVQPMAAPPGSPYAPGLDGTALELFDIVRNANFIINRVSLGNTNQSRLAWINETDYQGTPGTNVAEGAGKPL